MKIIHSNSAFIESPKANEINRNNPLLNSAIRLALRQMNAIIEKGGLPEKCLLRITLTIEENE